MKKVILVLTAIIAATVSTSAQGISPLIQIIHANKKGHADGTFQATNGTASPMVVTTEVKAFSLDADGSAHLSDIDKSKMTVSLDAMSARVPPLSSHTFTFTVDCPTACQFLILTYDGSARKVENGISVKTVLAETVYVEQPSPMQKQDVTVSWTDAHTLVLKNTSGKMARFSPNDIHYADKRTSPYPDFSLLPHATRVLHFPDAAPVRVELHAEHFAINATPAQ